MHDPAVPVTPSDVDTFLIKQLLAPEPELDAARQRAHDAGLPRIEVSEVQGKFLMLLAQIAGAKRILEIGTLGGYSTSWLARGVGTDGQVVTCEYEPLHAQIAADNLQTAGIADRVQIRIGAAVDTLDALLAEGGQPFDLVFIDADKENNVHYIQAAISLGKSGTVIVVDNVVRDGLVVHPADPQTQAGALINGVRAGLELLGTHPLLDATALQTVGLKGWDGFALARVR
ncbi:methyltransferase [Arthrobacter sp. MYb227]|uniref:O-methyltransferase n=1 Tax=Arthrobacter sp. MYb227 TaxID=1848601 RepID=UPI000CFADAAB|nr:O-methyltransferase [Arthrobacter sp. MYb227]PQZ89043.1 methyltransferase [Arthrobacter sp. MYb227]